TAGQAFQKLKERLVVSSRASYYWPAEACRCASPSAYSGHHCPAFGPPLHVPSDSPGCLTHRNASTRGRPVLVVGARPSDWPVGLHHAPFALPPAPFRLVSMM